MCNIIINDKITVNGALTINVTLILIHGCSIRIMHSMCKYFKSELLSPDVLCVSFEIWLVK